MDGLVAPHHWYEASRLLLGIDDLAVLGLRRALSQQTAALALVGAVQHAALVDDGLRHVLDAADQRRKEVAVERNLGKMDSCFVNESSRWNVLDIAGLDLEFVVDI